MKKNKKEIVAERFPIDIWELYFLAEICIPPTPIARAYLWEKLINVHYDLMSDSDKEIMYRITKSDRFDINNEECNLYEARYNPNNQYVVEVNYGGELKTYDAFKHEDKFKINTRSWISPEYIVSYKLKNGNISEENL